MTAKALSFPLLVVLLTGLTLRLGATEVGADATPKQPSSRGKVARALAETSQQYGLDAVRLESHLLQYTLQAGSILAASARIDGTRQSQGMDYLIVVLETGIVFNESDVAPTLYPLRIWMEIVEPTLRQFRTLDIAADGVVLEISYQHATYTDRDDLISRLPSRPPERDDLVFYLLKQDILDMVHSRTTASDLLARSQVDRNGRSIDIDLPDGASGPAAPPPTPGTRLLPNAWATKGVPL